MGRRAALIVVATLLALSWSATIPAVATDARGNEGGSILFEKRIFSSSAPLEATIGLWGFDTGAILRVALDGSCHKRLR